MIADEHALYKGKRPKRTEIMDVPALAPGLHDALASIEKQLTVDTAKLKQISKLFEEELREGLERDGANIVSRRAAGKLCVAPKSDTHGA